jgi:hypothetical protein
LVTDFFGVQPEAFHAPFRCGCANDFRIVRGFDHDDGGDANDDAQR